MGGKGGDEDLKKREKKRPEWTGSVKMGRRKRLAISFSPNQISCQLHHVHRLTPLDLLTCTQMITTRELLKDRIDTLLLIDTMAIDSFTEMRHSTV